MSEEKNPNAPGNSASRRQVIVGVAVALGSLAAGTSVSGKAPQQMTEAQSTGVEGLLTYLHQEVEFKASPQRIYEALLDYQQFSSFSGLPAEINRQEGGAFSLFGARILGRNVELVPNRRIVQAWRPASWDPGVYSIVKFELKEQGGHSIIVFDHTGFPEGSFRHLAQGWHERYWEPLRKFLV